MRKGDGSSEQGELSQEDRESIWSIPPARRALYFGLFTVYAFAGIGLLIWYHVFEQRANTWPETILSITQGIGIHTVGAAGLALLTIEGPQTLMVVADYLRKKLIEPLEEKRRAEAERRRVETEERLAKIRAEARAETEERLANIRAEVRAEAVEEVQSAWIAWNERRMEAEGQGESFDEPPPGTSTSEGE